jgi:hypothetical protein
MNDPYNEGSMISQLGQMEREARARGDTASAQRFDAAIAALYGPLSREDTSTAYRTDAGELLAEIERRGFGMPELCGRSADYLRSYLKTRIEIEAFRQDGRSERGDKEVDSAAKAREKMAENQRDEWRTPNIAVRGDAGETAAEARARMIQRQNRGEG